ncbi:MAG: uracil-DNA glycosylase [Nitrospirae bacterium]|nr:uracil-DNA glycosylase [Nitrospirota bacterium]
MGIERFPFPVSNVKADGVSDSPDCHTATIDLDLTVREESALYVTQPSPSEKAKQLSALRDKIGDCARCKLSAGRTNIVFGEGNPDARLMFIGEGPGEDEDLQGRPFVGKAGVLLTRLIEKMELRREDVYIANIVKCRPPGNREPAQDETGSCRGFLEQQIEIIRPAVIMTLGNVALQTLMNNPALKISAVRGKLLEFKGHTVIPTFHPAYLLRNPADKWKTWADAQKALEKLHHGH